MSEQAAKLARRMAVEAQDMYDNSDALLPFAEVMVRLAEALRKAIPAMGEIHGQDIGCPDCPPQYEQLDCEIPKRLDAALSAFDALVKGGEK